MAKILIAEDDARLSVVIRDFLVMEHHSVEASADGGDALYRLKTFEYDLVVLDWDLPELSGLEVLKEYRGRGGRAPILMLTGKDGISDKECGLDAGADDYLTKPFAGRELQARVRALLRRPLAVVGNILEFAGLKLDRPNYIASRDGEELSLLPREFDLLEFLMRNPNRVHATESLLSKVWADDSAATVAAVTTCIKRLRRKIDPDGKPALLNTVHGVGYKLSEPR